MIRPTTFAVNGREYADLFTEETVDGDFGLAVVRALWIVGATSQRAIPATELLDKLGIKMRTLRRYISRLRAAGFRIYYSRMANGYRSMGFDPAVVKGRAA